MPTEQENFTLVTVTQEEVNQAVRIIPHLGTLILVKVVFFLEMIIEIICTMFHSIQAMGRKKHFGHVFSGLSLCNIYIFKWTFL